LTKGMMSVKLHCLHGPIKAGLGREIHGADPCATDYEGNTPLHKILGPYADKKAVELLLEAGADINAANSDDSTPLIALAKAQNLDVSAFIQLRADPNRQDSGGNTALHHICKSWLLERPHVEKWLSFADNPSIKNKGETCLYNLRWGNGGQGRLNPSSYWWKKELISSLEMCAEEQLYWPLARMHKLTLSMAFLTTERT
jgi:hypothetical protein